MSASAKHLDVSNDPMDVHFGGGLPGKQRGCWPAVEGADRLPTAEKGGCSTEVNGCPVLQRLSILYDSNFSFLHYVFASLIAVTWLDSIPEKLVENSL